MKKVTFFGFALCAAVAFTSCKSGESAYKKAYEKAKQQELAQPEGPVVVEAPAVAAPVEQPKVVESAPVVTTGVKQEKVEVVSGSALQDYSVVCGSFKLKSNADALKAQLDADGYTAVVAFNGAISQYRVIVSTHADYATASQARDAFKAKYSHRSDFQGSWLLYSIK